MTYLNLEAQLHSAADTAKKFLATKYGYPLSKFVIEESLSAEVKLVPTLGLKMNDGQLLYVDVCSQCYPKHFPQVVVESTTAGMPISIIAVVSADDGNGGITADGLSQARRAGTGVVSVSNGVAELLVPPKLLSLSGAKHPNPSAFPKAWHPTIAKIRSKYEDGDPIDALKAACDELEALTLHVAVQASARGAWKKTRKPSAVTYAAGAKHQPWKSVIDDLRAHLDSKKLGVPSFNGALLSRLDSARDFRNPAAHKPKSFAARKERDERLRTHYETSCFLLADLLAALKPLKPKP